MLQTVYEEAPDQKREKGQGSDLEEDIDQDTHRDREDADLHHAHHQRQQRPEPGRGDADRQPTETGEERLDQSDTENAPGHAANGCLGKLGELHAPCPRQPPRKGHARALACLGLRKQKACDQDGDQDMQQADTCPAGHTDRPMQGSLELGFDLHEHRPEIRCALGPDTRDVVTDHRQMYEGIGQGRNLQRFVPEGSDDGVHLPYERGTEQQRGDQQKRKAEPGHDDGCEDATPVQKLRQSLVPRIESDGDNDRPGKGHDEGSHDIETPGEQDREDRDADERLDCSVQKDAIPVAALLHA